MSDLGARSGLRFEDFFAANFAVLVVQLNAHTASMVEAQDAVQEAFCRSSRHRGWTRSRARSTGGNAGASR